MSTAWPVAVAVTKRDVASDPVATTRRRRLHRLNLSLVCRVAVALLTAVCCTLRCAFAWRTRRDLSRFLEE